jgi:CDP-diacylglycerol--serine O-phosphatidyltransferase
MVSRLPVFSGKRVGKRVPPEMVLPVFVMVVLFFAMLVSYPWQVLTVGTVAYLGCLPLGWLVLSRTPTQGCESLPRQPTDRNRAFRPVKRTRDSGWDRPARLN